ncbi:MAG: glycosyltransferase family 4 protein [Acidobacteriota bacterium]
MTTIKLLAVMEANTVTGPAKNLLRFFRLMRTSEPIEGIRLEPSIVTFQRKTRDAACDNCEPSGPESSPNAFVTAARAQGVAVDVISERFRFDPDVVAQFRQIVARRAPDVVQTHMVKSHFLTKLAGVRSRYPWVAYHHGYTTTDLKMRGYNQLNRWSLPSADRVITVCGPFADQLARTGVRRDRIIICHNSIEAPVPVSEESKRELKQRLGITDGEWVVLTVGRLSHEKGHLDLLRALTVLRKINPALKFKLVIVGEGPEQARLEIESRSAELFKRVVFAGQTTNMQTYYEIADVLALPSHTEGSPNVLLEGMASGLPVVATAVGGVPEIAVNEETALLVAPKDAQSFADSLHRLSQDDEFARKLGLAAAVHVAQKFSPAAYVRSLIHVYRGLASEAEKAYKSKPE